MNDEILNHIRDVRNKVRYDTKSWDVETLLNKVELSETSSYDDLERSKYIESILIGFPTKNIIVKQRSNGKCKVVAGGVCIDALNMFINCNAKLVGLNILEDLNGLSYNDLYPSLQRYIQNTDMRIIVAMEDFDLNVMEQLMSFNRW